MNIHITLMQFIEQDFHIQLCFIKKFRKKLPLIVFFILLCCRVRQHLFILRVSLRIYSKDEPASKINFLTL